MNRYVIGFLAGFIATLLFHQPALATLAAVLHQAEAAASVFSLLARDLREPAAPGRSAPRGGDAAGEPFVGAGAPGVPAGEGGGCDEVGGCCSVPGVATRAGWHKKRWGTTRRRCIMRTRSMRKSQCRRWMIGRGAGRRQRPEVGGQRVSRTMQRPGRNWRMWWNWPPPPRERWEYRTHWEIRAQSRRIATARKHALGIGRVLAAGGEKTR